MLRRNPEVGGEPVHDLTHRGEALGFVNKLTPERGGLLVEGHGHQEEADGDADGEDDFEEGEGGGIANCELRIANWEDAAARAFSLHRLRGEGGRRPDEG